MDEGKGLQPMILSIRSSRACYWHRYGRAGYSLDSFDLTEQCGVMGLAVQENDDWHSDQPIALIGNEQDFWRAEFLGENEPIGAYLYVDQVHLPRLIRWLQSKQRTPRLYLYFNFDSYGMATADQIINQIPEADLFLPVGIDDVWERHAKINYLDPQHFDKVRGNLNLHCNGVRKVVALIIKTQMALPLQALTLTAKLDDHERQAAFISF